MKIAFLLTLCLSVVNAIAQDDAPSPVALHFAPRPGDHLLLISSDNSTDTDPPADVPAPDASPEDRLKAAFATKTQAVTHGEVGLDWKIEEPDADGNSVITVTYVYVRRELTQKKQVKPGFTNIGGEEVVDAGQMVVMDSREAVTQSNLLPLNWEQSPPIKKTVEDFEWVRGMLKETLIGHPFIVVVSSRGKVVAVRGMDIMWDNFREKMKERTAQGDRPALDNFIEAFFGDDNVTKTFTLNLLVPFPEQPVRAEESWSDEYEFEMSGLKLPVSRKLRLDGAPDADGTAALSGIIEMHFPKQKDQLIIDAKREYLSINTTVDVATGMYKWLNYTGSLEITGRDANAAENAAPAFYLNSHLSGSVKVKRLSWRDPADKSFLIYPGGEGAFEVRLGSAWEATAIDEKLNDMVISIFKQAASKSQLTATVQPLSLQYQWDHPLDTAAAKLKQTMETGGGSLVKITSSKLFETAPVSWVRFRMEKTKADGAQWTYWEQLGYSTSGQYTFELSRHGPPSTDADAEAEAILNNISMKQQAKP